MKRFFNISVLAFACAALLSTGCKDFLETSSSTDIDDNIAISNTGNLDKVLIGTYKGLLMGGNVESSDRGLCGLTGMLSYYDCAGVDITANSHIGTSEQTCYTFADGRTQANGGYTKAIWCQFYDHINRCNIVLDALDEASGPEESKTAIKGQAEAIRAISYFQLILNYQQTYAIAKEKRGVILRTSTSDSDELGFSTVAEVYTQIVNDLEAAKKDLASFKSSEPWRITEDVVCGWLARVYQVMGEWDKAYENANAVFSNHSTLMTEAEWTGGFDNFISTGVKEFIWGYVNDELNSSDCSPFNMWANSLPSYGEGGEAVPYYNFMAYYVTSQWLELFGNDATDYRASRLEIAPEDGVEVTDELSGTKMLWHRCGNGDSAVSHKWAYNKFRHMGVQGQCRPEQCLMRSSEMLLIMAEALANTGKEGEALTLLNKLQNARKVAAPTTTSAKADLLEAIYVERRKELLGEGVTGMYDNCRLQKTVTRQIDNAANAFAAHFDEHSSYWGKKAADFKSATLESNDYSYFCQIPEDEFAKNKVISQDDQNPFKGK